MSQEERLELKREQLWANMKIKWYNNRLLRSPDCNDPDHPGCANCEDDVWSDDPLRLGGKA